MMKDVLNSTYENDTNAVCSSIASSTRSTLIVRSGSAGTTAGLALGHALHRIRTPLVAVPVCDDGAFFAAKVESITRAARMRWPELPAPAPVEYMDGFQGAGYAVNRPEEWSLLREVAETEGILLDPVYTVKAMMALRQAIRDGRFGKGDKVLFLHTGGMFGIFPKRGEAVA